MCLLKWAVWWIRAPPVFVVLFLILFVYLLLLFWLHAWCVELDLDDLLCWYTFYCFCFCCACCWFTTILWKPCWLILLVLVVFCPGLMFICKLPHNQIIYVFGVGFDLNFKFWHLISAISLGFDWTKRASKSLFRFCKCWIWLIQKAMTITNGFGKVDCGYFV